MQRGSSQSGRQLLKERNRVGIANCWHQINSSSAYEVSATRPMYSQYFVGLIPVPGRLQVRFSSVNVSPSLMGLDATRLRLAISRLGHSDAVGCLMPLPNASSISRDCRTSCLSSSGSSEAL